MANLSCFHKSHIATDRRFRSCVHLLAQNGSFLGLSLNQLQYSAARAQMELASSHDGTMLLALDIQQEESKSPRGNRAPENCAQKENRALRSNRLWSRGW